MIDKILNYKTISNKDKIDRLLEMDAIMYTNMGSDSTKTERNEAKKKSRVIYRAIKTLDRDLGDMLLVNQCQVKKQSRKNIVKKLDEVFSQYIRLRNADAHGTTECFTCGKQDHWKKLQCGHFQSRKHYATRWEEINCQVQCSACNVFRYGEQYIFGLNLDKQYGKGTADNLSQASREIVKLSNEDLLDKIEHYKILVKRLS